MCALYVALGDSMSIDEYAGGPGRGAASLLWRNRDGDFPEWAGRELRGEGWELAVVAVDGATSGSVVGWQLEGIRGVPGLVTLTVGGNDLVMVYGDTAAAWEAVGEAAGNVDGILGVVRERYGEVPTIVVTTVYDPSDGTGVIRGSGLAAWPEGVEVLRELNAELRRVAARHGALVADVYERFLGHGSAAGDPSQLEARPPDRGMWYCGVIEPNAWGASEIRAAWWEALGRD